MDAQQIASFIANVIVTECRELIEEYEGLTVIEFIEVESV
jgi:hypothetical protein